MILWILAVTAAGCGRESGSKLGATDADRTLGCPWQQPDDLLLQQEAWNASARSRISPEAIKQDLDCLKNIFTHEYVAAYYYRDVKPPLAARVDALAATIDETMDQQELATRLFAMHQNLFDMHMSYYRPFNENEMAYAGFGKNYMFYVPLHFEKKGDLFVSGQLTIKECIGMAPVKALTSDGLSEYFTFAGQFTEGGGPEVGCRDANGDPVKEPLAIKYFDQLSQQLSEFSVTLRDDGILYVRMPSMLPGSSKEQDKMIVLISDASAEHPIIFDLRQNGGGADDVAYQLAELMRARTESWHGASVTDIMSLYSIAGTINTSHTLAWRYRKQGAEQEARRFEAQADEFAKQFRTMRQQGATLASVDINVRNGQPHPGSRNKSYGQPVVLLVDKGCASSCEAMIAQLRQLPTAHVIGTNSGGYLHFGNCGTFRLPNSGLMFYGGWRNFNNYVDAPEGVGHSADLYTLEGDDSLQTALHYIQRIKPRDAAPQGLTLR